SHHIHILAGEGAYEDPQASRDFAGVLYSKGINYELDIWGQNMTHDWPTWRAMLPYYIESRF
ncbi:MAG: esterase, partial [Ginsengibacter sp.]